MSEQDTREKLENDTFNFIARMVNEAYVMGEHEADWRINRASVRECIGELLNRQAAITRRETRQSWQDAPNILDRTNLQTIADLQAKVDELTAERDGALEKGGRLFDKCLELTAERDKFRDSTLAKHAQISDLQVKLDELTAERDRLRGELAMCQDVNERQDIEYVELKRERDRLQRVVRIQVESFKALEREITVLRRYAQSDGQTHRVVAGKPSDGLKTGDLRDAAYRHERLLIALWRWLDIKQLRGEPVTPEDVDMWREKLEREGVKPE